MVVRDQGVEIGGDENLAHTSGTVMSVIDVKVYVLPLGNGIIITDKTRLSLEGGGNVDGVSVRKDEEIQREEIEVSHKLCGAWEGRV